MLAIIRDKKLDEFDLSNYIVEFGSKINIYVVKYDDKDVRDELLASFDYKNGVQLYCANRDGDWLEKEFRIGEKWVEEGYDDVKEFLEKDVVCFYTVRNSVCDLAVFRYYIGIRGDIETSFVRWGSYHEYIKEVIGSRFVIISESVCSGMSPFIGMYAKTKDIKYNDMYISAGEEVKIYVWTANKKLSSDVCVSDDVEYIDKGFVLSGIDDKVAVLWGGVEEIPITVDFSKRIRFTPIKKGMYYVVWKDISDNWFVGVPTRRLALFPDALRIMVV